MGTTILVVDDEPAIGALVSELLMDEGYTVRSASDGQVALDLIAQDPPHLVISDVMMPRRDGLSILQTLRRAGSTVPVLLMSAAPLKPGAVGAPLVHKPFDLDDLLTQVHRLLAITHHDHEAA